VSGFCPRIVRGPAGLNIQAVKMLRLASLLANPDTLPLPLFSTGRMLDGGGSPGPQNSPRSGARSGRCGSAGSSSRPCYCTSPCPGLMPGSRASRCSLTCTSACAGGCSRTLSSTRPLRCSSHHAGPCPNACGSVRSRCCSGACPSPRSRSIPSSRSGSRSGPCTRKTSSGHVLSFQRASLPLRHSDL